jgi:hypothetical protein
MACVRTENQTQGSFSFLGPHEISVLIGLTPGHLPLSFNKWWNIFLVFLLGLNILLVHIFFRLNILLVHNLCLFLRKLVVLDMVF